MALLEKSIFLTSPIFYLNARPHLGHAYTLCLADAWSRYARLRGKPELTPFYTSCKIRVNASPKVTTFLSAGSDEHGIKVKGAASDLRRHPLDYCDEMSHLFQSICRINSVKLNDFLRTTEDRHKEAVQHFWQVLQTRGFIYRDVYTGWYSAADEAFYDDREVVPKPMVKPVQELRSAATAGRMEDSGNTASPLTDDCSNFSSKRASGSVMVSRDTGSAVNWVEETNFIFRLTDFKSRLHEWLDSGVFLTQSTSQTVWKKDAHEVVDACRDVSISRPFSRIDWGIPVPQDSSQTVYVWFDALVNYLTVCGYPWSNSDKKSWSGSVWPPDFQFFGQDILRFHAVLWPALLMAADLPLPRHLVCHHHILCNGVKMSKSRGNVLDPFSEQLVLCPRSADGATTVRLPSPDAEGLRYVLLRSALLSADSSYSSSLARTIVNTELVNTLGNLLSRVTSVRLNPEQSIIRICREEAGVLFDGQSEDKHLLSSLDTLASQFDHYWWERGQVHLAIDQVLGVVRQANALVNRHRPWVPDSSPVAREHVVAVAAEALRLSGLLLQPVVPGLAERLLRRLGVHSKHREAAAVPGQTLAEKYFRRLGPDKGPLLLRLSG